MPLKVLQFDHSRSLDIYKRSRWHFITETHAPAVTVCAIFALGKVRVACISKVLFRDSFVRHRNCFSHVMAHTRCTRPGQGQGGRNRKQECIPVGCVPPACWPYPSMHCSRGCTCPGGCTSQGVYLPGGYLPGYSPLWTEWQTRVKTFANLVCGR